MDGFGDYEDPLDRLGPHQTGKSCLHVKRLDDVDESVLRELTRARSHTCARADRTWRRAARSRTHPFLRCLALSSPGLDNARHR